MTEINVSPWAIVHEECHVLTLDWTVRISVWERWRVAGEGPPWGFDLSRSSVPIVEGRTQTRAEARRHALALARMLIRQREERIMEVARAYLAGLP